MFTTAFDPGFTLADLTGGISAFLGLAIVGGIIIGVLVLKFVPRIARTFQSLVGGRR